MIQRITTGLVLGGAMLFASAIHAEDTWLIRADTVYTVTGDPIDGGHVLVKGDEVAEVGPGQGGGGDALQVAAVTPGMIDLSVRISLAEYSVEQSDETPIELSVEDAIDLFSYRWAREARSGVTSALVSPYDNAVIGGTSVLLKTAGEPSLDDRLVKRAAALRGSMGSQPSAGNRAPRGGAPTTFYYRRPTTRMAVEWIFRKTYWDAVQADRRSGEVCPRQKERDEILHKTLKGELPLIVQAWPTHDIRTAIFLKEEFQIPHMYVDGGAEAWREPELLKRSGMGVILSPHSLTGRSSEGSFFAMNCAAKVHELGVPLALSAHGAEDPGMRLDRQAGFAMRGGLPFEAALAAVTINPAKMVGVDDRLGSIEVGKDADLVLWSGKPFELTSRVIGVLIDGQLVLDPRNQGE